MFDRKQSDTAPKVGRVNLIEVEILNVLAVSPLFMALEDVYKMTGKTPLDSEPDSKMAMKKYSVYIDLAALSAPLSADQAVVSPSANSSKRSLAASNTTQLDKIDKWAFRGNLFCHVFSLDDSAAFSLAEQKCYMNESVPHALRRVWNGVDTISGSVAASVRAVQRRRYEDDGISDDEIEGKRTFDLEEKLTSDRYNSAFVKFMEGKDLTFEYVQKSGLREPIVFRKLDGLGLKMPDPDFGIRDMALCSFAGSRRMVDVMDVNTQKGIEMTMAQWAKYYETPEEEREKLYNVISLEFSHTKLENLVQRPSTVDLIDWVDNMWPRHLKEEQTESTNAISDMKYPKVQKYCLMSVKGCYTDFHVDFGGTSVWYHVHRGGKVFWLVPPTPENLEMYENWVLSGKQGDIFLGDKVVECERIELKQGYTFVIPSGWIHAVYTPEDTLVFGGNFLHSFNIPMQLKIYNIEDRIRVPSKFRYPFYYEMCWYVLERYVHSLTGRSHLIKEFQEEALFLDLDQVNGLDSINVKEENTEENTADKDHKHLFSRTLDTLNGTVDSDQNGFAKSSRTHSPSPQLIKRSESPITFLSDAVNGPNRAVDSWSPLEDKCRILLTQFELEGLHSLVDKLESLPLHKKCVPTGIEDENALLEDIKQILEQHADDDRELAITGIPIIQWPKKDKSRMVNRPKSKTSSLPITKPHTMRPPPRSPAKHALKSSRPPGAVSSAVRRRRVRCRKCEACLRDECGVCHYCKDMKKFGGPGRMKQSCVLRQCMAPRLPHSVVCALCNTGDQEDETKSFALKLMECSICNEIVHPGCLKMDGEGILHQELPNCWECPKCNQPSNNEKVQPKNNRITHSMLRGERRLDTAVHQREDHLRRVRSIEMTRKRLEALPRRKQMDYLLLRKRKLAAVEQNVRKKIKLERERSLMLAKRKMEEGEVSVGNKILYPLKSGGDASHLSRSPSSKLKIIHLMHRPRTIMSRYTTRAGTSHDLSGTRAGRDERFKRRQLLRLQAAERCKQLVREKENNPSGKMELSEVERAKIRGSYLTVTLQRPPKTMNGASIVPKLQAITPTTNLRQAPRVVSRLSTDEGCTATDYSCKDSDQEDREEEEECEEDCVMQKDVWMSVFHYLSRKELCECMRVCKTWYKWCCDKRLWTKIDLSRCKSIVPQALSGIVKRQPVSLDLSWTNISKKQLTWLINRLPGIKDVLLAGCSWSAISALSTSSCPLLRTLDLRWAGGIKDPQIRDLLTPSSERPGQDNRSKLRNLIDFRLAGLDITDATLRLIIRHMPLLSRLDLSHCNHLTDQSVNLLTAVGSSTRNSLTEINLAGCNKLTDLSLSYLRRISSPTLIDLRCCKQITRGACEQFIADLSINSLYCLSDDKLIQKIS
ncbi:lysine-specific demethylase 2A-like [Protopterus annectens]|uniref:lysine-specific demethylase 2A-like n=1 Tax=Protopterus annectens TaxID=7888 RepID=UPI001CFB9716|nr:lysine-specific demethylase 2A-like [Protopterus annectens]